MHVPMADAAKAAGPFEDTPAYCHKMMLVSRRVLEKGTPRALDKIVEVLAGMSSESLLPLAQSCEDEYVYESVLLRKREKSTSLRRSRGSSLAVLPSARPPSPPPPQLDSSFSSPDNKSAAVRFAQPSNPFFVDVDSTLFQKAVNNVASALAAHVSQLALVALRLRVLPQRLVEIHTLLDLDLSANQLPDSAFSASFARLVRLKRLNLSTNLLTRVPAVLLQLQELTVLDMSSNAVTYIPDDLFKLEHLLVANFSSNAITQVPATITSNRIALQALNLDGNKIEKAVKPSVFSPSRFTLANNPATDTKIMRKELKDTST